MLLNTKFSSEENFKKFSGFVIGLLKYVISFHLKTMKTDKYLFSMSSLHIWFSKLKWSLDVLLRFYERHAFICALHKVLNFILFQHPLSCSFTHCVFSRKETKLLFDELNFCLQRLYSIPFHVDMPFNDSILEEITTSEASCIVSRRLLPFPLSIGILIFLSLQEPGALCQLCLHSNNSYLKDEDEGKTK